MKKTKHESGTMAVRKFQTSLPRLGFRLPNIFAKKNLLQKCIMKRYTVLYNRPANLK